MLFLNPRLRKPSAIASRPADSDCRQRELSVSAPLTILASRTRAGSRSRRCFLTMASKLHSLPWWRGFAIEFDDLIGQPAELFASAAGCRKDPYGIVQEDGAELFDFPPHENAAGSWLVGDFVNQQHPCPHSRASAKVSYARIDRGSRLLAAATKIGSGSGSFFNRQSKIKVVSAIMAVGLL